MTNLKTSRVVRVALAAMAAFAVAGCSAGVDAPTSPTPSATQSRSVSTTPTASVSPSPTPSTVSERAAVDATVAFVGVVDKLGADPGSDMEELSTVASGDALAQMQYNLSTYRENGWRQVGQRNLTFLGSTPGEDATHWLITMCMDVSAVDVVDAAGVSVKNHDAPSRVSVNYTVESWGMASKWYVTKEKVTGTC